MDLLSKLCTTSPPQPALSSSTRVKSRVRVFQSLHSVRPKPALSSFILCWNSIRSEPQKRMDAPRFVCRAENGSPAGSRTGEVRRVTRETDVRVVLSLDGSGIADSSTGIPFLDHMLDQLASHGLFDVHVKARGDIHIDDHHTNEDVALAIGTALLGALGDRKGINRFGDFTAPLDEALVHVTLDLSGRPHLSYDLQIPTQRVGTYDTQLVEHFFQSLANTSGMTLHIRQLAGRNSHHIIEATFKAFARALRQATEYDLRRPGTVPSLFTAMYIGVPSTSMLHAFLIVSKKPSQRALVLKYLKGDFGLCVFVGVSSKGLWSDRFWLIELAWESRCCLMKSSFTRILSSLHLIPVLELLQVNWFPVKG